MPIYEYKCNNCSKIFEEFIRESFNESDLICPYCSSKSIRRIMSSYSAFGSNNSEDGFSNNAPPSCGCGGGSCGI